MTLDTVGGVGIQRTLAPRLDVDGTARTTPDRRLLVADVTALTILALHPLAEGVTARTTPDLPHEGAIPMLLIAPLLVDVTRTLEAPVQFAVEAMTHPLVAVIA